MDERVLQLRIGLFLLIAMIILGILIMYNTEGWTSQYAVHVKPPTAPGVAVGTPVRKNGIRIGRVSSVKTQDDHVALTLKINQQEKVYEGEVCSIGTGSLLGDSVIEIVPVEADQRGELLTDQGILENYTVQRNPMELVDVAINLEDDIKETLSVIRDAGVAVDQAGRGINDIAQQIQGALSDNESDLSKTLSDFRTMSQKAQLALDQFNAVFENINTVVGDPEFKVKLNDALSTLPTILEEVRNTITTTKETVGSFQEVSRTAATNLENLESLTAALKQDGPEIVTRVNNSLKNIDELVIQIKGFADGLEDFQLNLPDFSKGSMGKLLNETELYDNANEALANIRDITVKLDPLVDDVRILADGLSRDPGQLIRGAFDGRPNNTGYKPHLRGITPRRSFNQGNGQRGLFR